MPSKYGFGNTRKKSPAYKKSSAYKMKNSPTKFKLPKISLGGAFTGGGSKFGGINMLKDLFK
tara:strand:+ start:54 stop:239 length:186 start_codon:yes stop_codon:yes gene_type:complete